jgi:diacylglycerol kinase family enzyme
MSRRRALDVRRNDAHFAVFAGHFREHTNAWAVDAVIVRDQDAHADPACKEPAANGPALEFAKPPEVYVQISLFHNEEAGDGSSDDEIKALLTRHGHRVVQVVSDDCSVEQILETHADLVVAAGGDGTVATAARVLAGGKLPLAILPLGTANNIAKSLGYEAPLDALVDAWTQLEPRKLDLGVAHGQWGKRVFIESVGAGLIPSGIAAAKAQEDGGTAKPEDAVQMFRDALARLAPQPSTITIDGEAVTSEFLLVEVMNIPSIGPNLVLSDRADPGDGLFSVVVATEADRDALDAYLLHRSEGGSDALSLPYRHARLVEFHNGTLVHVDDRLLHTKLPQTVAMAVSPAALTIFPGPLMDD